MGACVIQIVVTVDGWRQEHPTQGIIEKAKRELNEHKGNLEKLVERLEKIKNYDAYFEKIL